MHILGHVLIWFIALGAMAATVLSAKTFEIRNSWIKQVDQLKKETDEAKPVIAEKEAQLRLLREQLHQTMLSWDRFWPQVNGQIDQNFVFSTQDTGLMQWANSAGQAAPAAPAAPVAGQAAPPAAPAVGSALPVVYVFRPQPDGSSLYLGSFQYDSGSGSFLPTWTVRASDYDGIKPEDVQGPFRVRSIVPPDFTNRYADIRTDMILTERQLTDKTQDFDEVQIRMADAQKRLDNRKQELGDADQATGVVGQLQIAEDARNVELEELDYWRRQVNDAKILIEDLVKANRELEQQIKQPATDEPEATNKVASRP